MINDRIRRIFQTSRFNALLLEVFAIFLGITASFAVEEWRGQRQDRENFESYLAAIYFDALREEAELRRFVARGNQAVVAIHTLLNETAAELSDTRLMTLAGKVFSTWSLPRRDGSFRALQTAGIAMPFDNTMQVLNASYARNADLRSQLDAKIEEHNDMVDVARSEYGTATNPTMPVRNEDRSVSEGSRFDQPAYHGIRHLFFRDGQFIPLIESIHHARRALREDEVLGVLAGDLERTMQAMDLAIALADTTHDVRQAVRERVPDIRLDVRSLSIVGDATPTGWTEARGLPLRREHGDSDWWYGEVELGAGAIKFVANEIWGTSWGAPIPWAYVDPMVEDRMYLGDRAAVFPSGIAEFDGLNIPVEPGRYAVRFNVHTFEYAFTRLPDQAPRPSSGR